MQFVYTQGGASPRKWDFDPSRLMNAEAEAIERVSKLSFAEWADAVTRGHMGAIHALLWVMLKRVDPTLAYDAVQFSLSEIDFELDDEESATALAALEARVAAGEELPPGELGLLTRLRETAPAAAGQIESPESDDQDPEGDEAPKDALVS